MLVQASGGGGVELESICSRIDVILRFFVMRTFILGILQVVPASPIYAKLHASRSKPIP
jgi:hypothetical protein